MVQGLSVRSMVLDDFSGGISNSIDARRARALQPGHALPPGFVPPCKAQQPPTGDAWLHEIKHDGFRIIARKDGDRVRLYSRPGNDLTYRFPLIVEAVARLRALRDRRRRGGVLRRRRRVELRPHPVPAPRRERIPVRVRPNRARRRRPAARAARHSMTSLLRFKTKFKVESTGGRYPEDLWCLVERWLDVGAGSRGLALREAAGYITVGVSVGD
jgi:ATP dependent DNA ligase-like protein